MNSLVVDGCGPIIDPLSAVDFLDSSFMRDPLWRVRSDQVDPVRVGQHPANAGGGRS